MTTHEQVDWNQLSPNLDIYLNQLIHHIGKATEARTLMLLNPNIPGYGDLMATNLSDALICMKKAAKTIGWNWSDLAHLANEREKERKDEHTRKGNPYV